MTSQSSPSRGSLRARIAAVFVALIPALVKLFDYPHNIGSDDAYIHLRVAENFVHGLGWGINPYQPVNLSTAPAFTFLLAAIERLSSHPIGVMQVISGFVVVAGLLAIYATALAETASIFAGLFAEVTAAFSLNLWRWNGTLMETTFAFSIVAVVLYLLRRGRTQTAQTAGVLGIVLGMGLLMRPEMGMLCILASCVLALRAERGKEWQRVLVLLIGVSVAFAAWFTAARNLLKVTVIPTTFAAKSVHGLILWNPGLLKQLSEAGAESFLIPGLFVAGLFCFAWRQRSWKLGDWTSYVLPLTWTFVALAFYYLKTRDLESTGRYLLPLLPAEAILLALVWKGATRLGSSARLKIVTIGVLACDAAFALAVNQIFVAPVLRRFEDEYAASMRAAAEELQQKAATFQNKRVLVLVDIGVLSYAGAGKFEVFDGGALATPYLHGLTVEQQVERVQPSYVVESLATTPEGLSSKLSPSFSEIWSRRFFRHSLGVQQPYYYVIVFEKNSGA